MIVIWVKVASCLADNARSVLVGWCGARHCFWHHCDTSVLPLPLHSAAEAGGHVLALVFLAVMCGAYGQRALLLVSNQWRYVTWIGIEVGTCKLLVLGTSLQLWQCARSLKCFHTICCQAVGLCVIWCNNSGFDPCPFHEGAVFMAETAIKGWASIYFHFFWKAV